MTRSGKDSRRQHKLTEVLFLLLFTFGSGSLAMAEPVVEVEGETYGNYLDLGGYEIQIVECTSASGGYSVDGIDVVGEWIELSMPLPKAGCYDVAVAFQGYVGEQNSFVVSLPASGGETTRLEFVGVGIGCDFDYVWDQGDERLCVDAPGDHIARIELESGTRSRVDIARFAFYGTLVEAESWSLIKSCYR